MPYAGMTNDQVAAAVTSGTRLDQPGSCPDAIFAILVRCWAFKPANRPTFQQLSQQLAAVIRRLRQGATDYDLMQSPKLRRPAAEGLVSARPLYDDRAVFNPASAQSARASIISNQYLLSRTNSQIGDDDSAMEAMPPSLVPAKEGVYEQPRSLNHRASGSSLDDAGVTSRPYDDHVLAGTFVRFNDLSEDGTIILEPECTKHESLRQAMHDDNSILHEYQVMNYGFDSDTIGSRALSSDDSEYLTIMEREQASMLKKPQRPSRISALLGRKAQTSQTPGTQPSPSFEGGAL